MMCAWKELIMVLPPSVRDNVDKFKTMNLQELRLRINAPPELICAAGAYRLHTTVKQDELIQCVNLACRYSPWAAASVSSGYITVSGGHRIGICGETVCRDGKIQGIKNPTSLCIRVARDVTGLADRLQIQGSVLILGAPGWGKTTLLRNIVRKIGERYSISVVDERSEVFPDGFSRDGKIDVLSGCTKPEGIPILIRTMSPVYLAVDEITDHTDSEAIYRAWGCGVKLVATAHASSLADFSQRLVYQRLYQEQIFDRIILLKANKSFDTVRGEL